MWHLIETTAAPENYTAVLSVSGLTIDLWGLHRGPNISENCWPVFWCVDVLQYDILILYLFTFNVVMMTIASIDDEFMNHILRYIFYCANTFSNPLLWVWL